MRKNDDRFAIYSRKSKYTGKGESIGNQVELGKEHIRAHYGEDALERVTVYEDEGFSGGDLNRPAFKRMMEAAKQRKFHTLIVYRLDRISRNVSDFSNLIEELSRLDISFVSIREQFDTSTPMGRAMMYIASVFSQLERETIAERIRDNMHELAKTGRWLGGVTPTGYTSESVESVTVDGKAKKACKLKLIPEEAEIVKTIYDLFVETGSLTLTEAELMRRRITTKNGRHYTRFSIKNILQNPVYMISDQQAYDYFAEMDAELFSDRSEFDGEHGLLAYNRTDQQKGRSTVYLPIQEWIITVGKHPGLIPGRVWVNAQRVLEQNKSKSYRRPRGNEALLTGLLYCRCGSRMYPKLTKRINDDGKPAFSYVCKIKEHSKKSVCSNKNVSGNLLDAAVIEQVKSLESDTGTFIKELEKSRKYYTGNRTEYEQQLAALRQERVDTEKKIDGLVDSLTEMGGSSAKAHVTKRIEQLHQQCQSIDLRIQELDGLTNQQALNDSEFDVLRQLLSVFSSSIDVMTVEQKRTAIRTLVRKVVWDGANAHVVLFGASDDDIEYPELPGLDSGDAPADDAKNIEGRKDDHPEEKLSSGVSKTRWRSDSK